MLRAVRACNSFTPSRYVPVLCRLDQAFVQIGSVLEDNLEDIDANYSSVFDVSSNAVVMKEQKQDGKGDGETLDGFLGRSLAMEEVNQDLYARGKITSKWRAEPYACVVAWDQMPPLQIERAATTYWGVHTFGVHCNGYVVEEDSLWVGKRAADKATFPGQLDNLSAGGLAVDERPAEAMVRELEEEASMEPGLAKQLIRPGGLVTYCEDREEGAKIDTLFVFDLDIPASASFQPSPGDDEVESFELADVEGRIMSEMETEPEESAWKPNCRLVVIDWLLRRGRLGPDMEPQFSNLVSELRAPATLYQSLILDRATLETKEGR